MTNKVKAAGRFGVRYGKSVRKRITEIESIQRKKQRCPFCKHLTAKRVIRGIWLCKKCKRKFTGGTYHLGQK